MENIYFSGTLISVAVASILFFILIVVLYSMIDKEDRTYMDPLSWKLKLLWPQR